MPDPCYLPLKHPYTPNNPGLLPVLGEPIYLHANSSLSPTLQDPATLGTSAVCPTVITRPLALITPVVSLLLQTTKGWVSTRPYINIKLWGIRTLSVTRRISWPSEARFQFRSSIRHFVRVSCCLSVCISHDYGQMRWPIVVVFQAERRIHTAFSIFHF